MDGAAFASPDHALDMVEILLETSLGFVMFDVLSTPEITTTTFFKDGLLRSSWISLFFFVPGVAN